jgi:Flp pilus assembly protein TadD
MLLLAVGGVGLAAVLAFSGSLGHNLLEFDDNMYVYENPLIYPLNGATVIRIFTTPYFRSYTPLTLLSHAIDFDLWGKQPFGHHLSNVLIHGINSVLVLILAILVLGIRRLEGNEVCPNLRTLLVRNADPVTLAAPIAAALLFALHPLRVESVSWVSDRKDLLLTLFAIPSLIAYLLYGEHRGRGGRVYYTVALITAGMAMLAKTIGTMLPIVFLLVDAFPLRPDFARPRWQALLREKIPFLTLSLGAGLMSVSAVQGVLRHPGLYHPTPLEKILQPTYALAFYLAKTVWPFDLTPMYTGGSLFALVSGLIGVVSVTALCIRAARHGDTKWLLAWGSYLLLVVPTVIGKPTAGIQAWADRYSYLPSVPLVLMFGSIVGAGLMGRGRIGGLSVRRLTLAVTFALMTFLTVQTIRQVPLWHDDERLWRYAIAVDREAVMAHTNLAMILTAKGRADEALAAADSAIALKPEYASAHGAKGLAYDIKGDTAGAIKAYTRAIQLDSNYIDAYSNLGNVYLGAGRYDEAVALYTSAIRRDPTFFSAYYNMGIAYYRRGDLAAGMDAFEATLRVNPTYPNTYFNMGIIYADWGDHESARRHFIRAADLGYEPARQVLRDQGLR